MMHNEFRARYGQKSVAWGKYLQDSAQNYANVLGGADNCVMQHGNSIYGENLYMITSAHNPSARMIDATRSWVSEFNGISDELKVGPFDLNLGHATQILWYSQQSMGCGYSTCKGHTTFVVCHYYPKGNTKGESFLGLPTGVVPRGGLGQGSIPISHIPPAQITPQISPQISQPIPRPQAPQNTLVRKVRQLPIQKEMALQKTEMRKFPFFTPKQKRKCMEQKEAVSELLNL